MATIGQMVDNFLSMAFVNGAIPDTLQKTSNDTGLDLQTGWPKLIYPGFHLKRPKKAELDAVPRISSKAPQKG